MHSERVTAPGARLSVIMTVILISCLLLAAASARIRGDSVFCAILALLTIPVASQIFTVRDYEVTDDAVLVRRFAGRTTRLSRCTLISAAEDPNAFSWALQIPGRCGPWYWSSRIGLFRALVTDFERPVILRFSNQKPVVVSPSDPVGFIRALFPPQTSVSTPDPV